MDAFASQCTVKGNDSYTFPARSDDSYAQARHGMRAATRPAARIGKDSRTALTDLYSLTGGDLEKCGASFRSMVKLMEADPEAVYT